MSATRVDAGHVDEPTKLYDIDEFAGSAGSSTTWSVAPGTRRLRARHARRSQQRHYLNLYKLGEGPLYSFLHALSPVPLRGAHHSVARAVLFHDAVLQPLGGPLVEVVTVAKIGTSPAGEVMDELGGYLVYGEAEAAAETARGGHLPIGVAVGARLVRDVAKDAVLTYADVALPEGRLVDRLRAEQAEIFGLARAAE